MSNEHTVFVGCATLPYFTLTHTFLVPFDEYGNQFILLLHSVPTSDFTCKIESLPSPFILMTGAMVSVAAPNDFMHILKLNDAIDCEIIYRE